MFIMLVIIDHIQGRGKLKEKNKIFPVIKLDKIPLPGWANQQNSMAAIAATYLCKVKLDKISKSLESFTGLPHRLQFLGEYNGKKFYDDSDATTPESTIFALNALKTPIILITGGSDKGFDYSELGREIAKQVKLLITIGQTGVFIKNHVISNNNSIKNFEAKNLEEAVKYAKENSLPGDSIVLSPASASFEIGRAHV